MTAAPDRHSHLTGPHKAGPSRRTQRRIAYWQFIAHIPAHSLGHSTVEQVLQSEAQVIICYMTRAKLLASFPEAFDST